MIALGVSSSHLWQAKQHIKRFKKVLWLCKPAGLLFAETSNKGSLRGRFSIVFIDYYCFYDRKRLSALHWSRLQKGI